MLYMVECDYTDAATLAEWSAWYSGPKIGSLIVLAGWCGSQRFEAVDGGVAKWLAVHAVVGPELFESDAYKNAGGGNFADWGDGITNWSRNLFDGVVEAPEVAEGSCLALADVAPDRAPDIGVEFTWLRGVGLDNTVPSRGLAVVPSDAALGSHPNVRFYRPMTPLIRG